MNRFIIGLVLILFSCNSTHKPGAFQVSGELKGAPDQQVFLEQISFDQQQPRVIDTAKVVKGKFSIGSHAIGEGLYRLRFESNPGFLFINDRDQIDFVANAGDSILQKNTFNTPANASLTNLILMLDSIHTHLMNEDMLRKNYQEQKNDSMGLLANENFEASDAWYNQFLVNYVDTAKSPIVSLFAFGFVQEVNADTVKNLVGRLTKKFPENSAVKDMVKQYEQYAAAQQQTSSKQGAIQIGQIAPDFTLPDADGKPFTLSSLRGKYVLLDFWASWCGPCREENPNVVVNYTQFKNKNFTVLGVSLDKDKAAWLKAIKDDGLAWKQVSDLKFWNSEAATLYQVQGIPFNVLIDPQGKIIATELRGPALNATLKKVLQ